MVFRTSMETEKTETCQSDVAESWRVLRQDDSGNQFVVEAKLTHLEAQDLVDKLEARGHKQTYWSENSSARE